MGGEKPTYEELVRQIDELNTSAELFKGIFNHSNDAIFLHASNGPFLEVNDVACERYGYSRDEFLKISPMELDDPEHARHIKERTSRILNDGTAIFQTDHVTKDGKIVHAEISSRSIIFKGEPAILSSARDITERRHSLEAIRESEERFRILFEGSHDAIMTLEPPSWLFTNGNPATIKMFGAKDETEFASLSPWQLSPEKQPDGQNSSDKAKMMIEKAMRDGSNFFEWVHKKHNGADFPATVLLTRIEIKGKTMLQATVRDISEQKLSEKALVEKEEQLRLAFENTRDAIFWADAKTGILINCNKSAENLLERPREEIIGQYQSFLHPEDRNKEYEEMFRKHIENNETEDAEAEVITKSGNRVPVLISSTVVEISGNKINQGVFRNISEQKRAQAEKEELQQQLHQSQKMEAIGQLAGGIAHEFNNILAVIIGTAEQAAKGSHTLEKQKKHMERITRVANRARDLTMKLLVFSRQEQLDVRLSAAETLVEDTIDLLKRTLPKNINIHTTFSPSKSLISIDMNQMSQAFLNICINAADSMPEGGTLTICCKEELLGPEECKKLSELKPGSYSVFSIVDTGSGMTEDTMEKIFNPFFTTKKQGSGTGLGLPITLGIVKNHGGTVSIDSAPGKGTRVQVYIPIQENPDSLYAPCTVEEEPETINGTVLIIDDEPDFLEMASEILKTKGCGTIQAIGASNAIKAFRIHGNDIDLVILDMKMPDMDGTELFHALRKIKPDLKVLVCSGYSDDGKVGKLIREGARGFLQKPFNSAQLVRSVSDLM